MKKNTNSSRKAEQPAREYAEEVRAHGPGYRGRGILPGWAIAMTTHEGTPISRVYKVFGSIKARALALALCRQHRRPRPFDNMNPAPVSCLCARRYVGPHSQHLQHLPLKVALAQLSPVEKETRRLAYAIKDPKNARDS